MTTLSVRPPNPGSVATTEILKVISDPSMAIPTEITVGNQTASIIDLAATIDCFRQQRHMLIRFGQTWPCVAIWKRSQERESIRLRVPLDLGTPSQPHGDKAEIMIGHAGQRVTYEATAVGFQVKEILPTEVGKTFSEMVGEIIGQRIAGDSFGNSEPPPGPFEVTTDSPGIEILYSKGYFVSTTQGFGFSTPARKELRWGQYLFGTCVGGSTTFSDTLWTVPETQSIHIAI